MCVCFLDTDSPLAGPTQEIRDLQAAYRALRVEIEASMKRIVDLKAYGAPETEIKEEQGALRFLVMKKNRTIAEIVAKWKAWREANPEGEGPTLEELDCCVPE